MVLLLGIVISWVWSTEHVRRRASVGCVCLHFLSQRQIPPPSTPSILVRFSGLWPLQTLQWRPEPEGLWKEYWCYLFFALPWVWWPGAQTWDQKVFPMVLECTAVEPSPNQGWTQSDLETSGREVTLFGTHDRMVTRSLLWKTEPLGGSGSMTPRKPLNSLSLHFLTHTLVIRGRLDN